MRGVRAAAVLAIAWAPLTLAGCKPARSGPPINAVLPRGWRYVSGEARLGDTTLLGRCEWRGSGSVATWYGGLYWDVASFDVLRVERGRWPHKKLTFDCRYYYYWSRSRSGDRSSRAPRPYQRDDDVWAFHLVTSRKPARIIGQQRRSYLPPHKKELVPCSLDFFKPADRRICDRVTAAVRKHLKEKGRLDLHFRRAHILEETETQYVVRSPPGWLLIDKKTYAVKRLEIK